MKKHVFFFLGVGRERLDAMKFKKIVEGYYTFEKGEDVGILTLPYPDSQVGTSTYSGFVTEQLNILYDKADPTTRATIGDINWAQNYLVKTNTTDNKTRDFNQETGLIVLKDGIIQFSYFSSREVQSNGYLQNTLPNFFTILGGTEKYLGIRGYVKVQRLSLENQIRKLEVFKECGSGYRIADLV